MDHMTGSEVLSSPIDVAEEWITYQDESLEASELLPRSVGSRQRFNFLSPVLPLGTTILGIYPHGSSYWCGWTRTSEIETEQADGSELSFFLKVSFSSA